LNLLFWLPVFKAFCLKKIHSAGRIPRVTQKPKFHYYLHVKTLLGFKLDVTSRSHFTSFHKHLL
jgi:hypothetical protein